MASETSNQSENMNWEESSADIKTVNLPTTENVNNIKIVECEIKLENIKDIIETKSDTLSKNEKLSDVSKTEKKVIITSKNYKHSSSAENCKIDSSSTVVGEKSTTSSDMTEAICETGKIKDIEEGGVVLDDDLPLSAVPVKRGRKRGQIYSKFDDPETRKAKQKKRALELKMKHLNWTLNQPSQVLSTRKRETKAPQRFEICPTKKRQSCVENCQGDGDNLGSIPWIVQQLRNSSLYVLRLLHRVIYRKQGMFADKHIIKSVCTFSGFPFDATSPELSKRRDQLDKANDNALQSICTILGIKGGPKEDMIDQILGFLMSPSADSVDLFLKEVAQNVQQKAFVAKKICSPQEKARIEAMFPESGVMAHTDDLAKMYPATTVDINAEWTPPPYFNEGNGIKLKFIRAVLSNINMSSESMIDLLHRLLFLKGDEKTKMRRNILEFSGFKCEIGSSEYVNKARILNMLPLEQVKLICNVLCLPTWHRSRQLLADGVMDFLQVPRISAMKKRVPPHFTDEITFSFDGAQKPDMKSVEMEEIEIVPDIIMPDDTASMLGYEFGIENEYLGVKLKNFSNIHYQVISTPAAKLNDVHMVLYLKPSSPNNVRKNVLEFSGYPFDEHSPEFNCRRALMEQMSVEDLKNVAAVLCVSQYIIDESKNSLIDAIMKFLLKPSALLNSSTIMPTISPAPVDATQTHVVKKKATSTSKFDLKTTEIHDVKPKQNKLALAAIATSSGSSAKVSCSTAISPQAEKFMSSLPKSLQIKSLPPDIIIKEVYSINPSPIGNDGQPLPKFNKEANTSIKIPYIGSDEDDDQPLSKMVGHPNDDQLKVLVGKIMKDSKLEDITMKHVIQRVFETYPSFDLAYRKEYIKSIVRQILSQMVDQNCSVSTTVVAI